MFGAEEDIKDDEGGPDRDGGVGDVEGRVVITAKPQFEEIGDAAVDDSIGEITASAAEQGS